MPTRQVPGHFRTTNAPNRVLYLGGYVDEAIVRERGLRSHNVAGSNRMQRLGQAIAAAGFRPVLLSPATSLHARTRGPILLPVRVHRAGTIPAVFAAMINFPGLNVLAAPLMQFLVLRALLLKGDVAAAVIYNFNPSLVLLAAYMKYVWGLKLLQNMEDISEPKLCDWLPKSETRPVQQIIYWMCQYLLARMANTFVVPTRRFLEYLPQNSTSTVVTGCIAVDSEAASHIAAPLRVLFAGKVEREHGIHILLKALQKYDQLKDANEIEVEITGTGDMALWVEQELKTLRYVKAHYHGFTSTQAYRELLESADVCLALQDPQGRHASFKTPSKVYEFLGYGKAVIATDVGDIAELSDDILIVLPALTTDALVAALERLAVDPNETIALGKRARAHAERHYSYEAVGAVLHRLLTNRETVKT